MAAAMIRRASAPLHHLLLSGQRSTSSSSRGALSQYYRSGWATTEHFSTFASFHINFRNHAFYKCPLGQARWASSVSSAKSSDTIGKISIGPQKDGSDEKEGGFVYHGPISSTIQKVKLLSLSTCCLSVTLGPVITFMTSPDMNIILKGGLATTVILLSASTTAVLHWFSSPYVHKLRWKPGSDTFEVEMMSWLATLVPRTIRFVDILPADTKRPYVTFMANGDFYFVDVENCHNKALVQKLTPQPVQSAFKNI